jgi:putative transposase
MTKCRRDTQDQCGIFQSMNRDVVARPSLQVIDIGKNIQLVCEPDAIGALRIVFGIAAFRLDARGMTTRDIQGHLEEMYGIEVSATLISNVTEAVIEEVKLWQNRPLEELYPIVYLDPLMVKVCDEGHIQNKAIYVVLGVNLEGQKEVLGLWVAQTEGAKFWLQVLTELQSRGVKDIFIACVDGLKGFPEAIEAVYPRTEVQLCIVHLVRA